MPQARALDCAMSGMGFDADLHHLRAKPTNGWCRLASGGILPDGSDFRTGEPEVKESGARTRRLMRSRDARYQCVRMGGAPLLPATPETKRPPRRRSSRGLNWVTSLTLFGFLSKLL